MLTYTYNINLKKNDVNIYIQYQFLLKIDVGYQTTTSIFSKN